VEASYTKFDSDRSRIVERINTFFLKPVNKMTVTAELHETRAWWDSCVQI